MKSITVIPATGGQYRDLTIEPRTTARDIKNALGLSGENVLTKGKGSEPIPDDENLYDTLSDGAKLYATTPVEWGGSFFDWLLDIIGAALEPAPKRVRIDREYTPFGQQSSPVHRTTLPYWVERGWTRIAGAYTGEYQTPFGRWPGRISLSPGGRVDTFIATPPPVLKRHAHWPCFRKRDDGWFFVHPVSEVPDVSAAILAVEQTLNEAFTKK